ncbi:hypothetical protein [Pseudomonas putida]|uniref:Uncharacterized protein n=1 Tax=Pseudomonas putida TaxID=303 RepID=A0A8I1EC69_PSEPU|nr:hypothetical protein [Pseudomonas putida]MBI6882836.1 hypothetical protein [Pseudomonas putida]
MSKGAEMASQHLNEGVDLLQVCSQLNYRQKLRFFEWLVDVMVFPYLTVKGVETPSEAPHERIYDVMTELLAHPILDHYAAAKVLERGEKCRERTGQMLEELCKDHPVCTLAIITGLEYCPQDLIFMKRGLRAQLDTAHESVWLDAAKTTKTKIQLYQLTKWRSVLDLLPRQIRGRILEEEIGL